MNVFEAVQLRRSVRAFAEDEVSDEAVERLLEAARWAPSAGNIQPWEFVVVRKPETKRKLAKAALDQNFIEEAPVAIVVCVDHARSGQGYGDRGISLYCIQDAAAATENMLLAACALGLGACWVGAFREDEARAAINAPRDVRPVAIIPVGHPAESPMPPHKRPLKDMVHRETF